MTHRVKFEISDWLKIIALSGGMVVYGVTMRKDVDAQAATISRIESKVDGLLIANSRMAVLEERLDELSRRLEDLRVK